MPAQHLRPTLLKLIALRAVLVSVLLGTTAARITSIGDAQIDPLFSLIALTYALTALYAVTLPSVETRPWLVDLQLASDVVLVSGFVLLTGGIDSSFTSLFVLPVAAAGVVRHRLGGLRVAGLSACLLLGIIAGQYGGSLPAGWLGDVPLPPTRVALSMAGLNVLGLVAIGLLTGYLAERLSAADQHLAEASVALADLEALNQSVIDSMTGGLVTSDRQGAVLTFNRAAETITGLFASNVRGCSATDVLSLPPALTESLRDMVGDGRTRRAEYRFTRGDGRILVLGLTMAPLVNGSRRIGCLVSFQDLTETRRLERDIETQKRLAAIGQVASGMAHEIRNPLASMSGSIQVLRHELTLNDEQRLLMDIVLRESARLNDLIESFLSYARPKQRSVAAVDVRRLLNETAVLLRNSPECTSHHRVAVDVPPEPLWLSADEAQLRQVLWNLATNGLRAMAAGGALRLSADRETRGDRSGIALDVRDEGIGIPHDERDAVFQPFRSSFEGGTGLGLAIVHRIVVSESKGAIDVDSEPGRGTCVHVFLPDALQVGTLADDTVRPRAVQSPAA